MALVNAASLVSVQYSGCINVLLGAFRMSCLSANTTRRLDYSLPPKGDRVKSGRTWHMERGMRLAKEIVDVNFLSCDDKSSGESFLCTIGSVVEILRLKYYVLPHHLHNRNRAKVEGDT